MKSLDIKDKLMYNTIMTNDKCYKCGVESDKEKLYSTFGKKICKTCLDKRKKTGTVGNSGMVYKENIQPENYTDIFKLNIPIAIELVKKSHPLYVKWFIEHYPESKGIVGRQLNYLIYRYGVPVGIIGFASPPLNYKKFNTFFNFDKDRANSENGKFFLNNNVFRIVVTEPNLGTQVLKIARNKVKKDYLDRYGGTLIGLVTFVEPPRTGSMYKADNWTYIGETEGVEVKRRGESWTEKSYTKGVKKFIYGYKYK